jgi:starch synthase/alpha-amylase
VLFRPNTYPYPCLRPEGDGYGITFRIPTEIESPAKTVNDVKKFSIIVILGNVKLSIPSAQPRILFVIPEVSFIPGGKKCRHNFVGVRTEGSGDYLAEIISDLIHLGIDVHVAQPDYRRIFAILVRDEQISTGVELSNDRVHLAEDRTLFYSKPINSNPQWENIKISLAFQREVINQIIPRVQPDLVHCYDWMTGLIPAAARIFKPPCLFTAQKFGTAGSSLSYIEDRGIDAAVFWQHLLKNFLILRSAI